MKQHKMHAEREILAHQILLTELLDAAHSFIGKGVHDCSIIESCMDMNDMTVTYFGSTRTVSANVETVP